MPDVPLRHGHAISIDMAFSATLANVRGLLSDDEHRRLLGLFSRAGLTMDHHQFDEQILDKGTKAILRTRDGLLRAVVPNPLGSCVFLNDVSQEDLFTALKVHKALMKNYPRNGDGIDAFVDASDTGEFQGSQSKGIASGVSKETMRLTSPCNGNSSTTGVNGHHTNGDYVNGGCQDAKMRQAENHTNGAGVANGVPNGGHSRVANGTKV